MAFFSSKSTEDIDIGGGNTVTIRAKMTFKINAAVQRELLQMKVDGAGEGGGVTVHFGEYAQLLALLKYNVKSWRGPDFIDETGQPVRFSADALESLDFESCEGWIRQVAERINELNTPKKAEGVDDPNAPEPFTSTA
jgi:hypothetical protein